MPCRLVDDLGGGGGGGGGGKVTKQPLQVSPECIPALVRNGDKAFSNVYGIHRAIVVDHHRLFGRLGVEDPHVGSNPFLSAISPDFSGLFCGFRYGKKHASLWNRVLFCFSYYLI